MVTSGQKRLLASGLFVALFLFVFPIGATEAGERVLYVSPKGNDAWSGALQVPNAARTDGPLASPRGARNALRKLRRHKKLTAPVRVEFADGTYRLARTVLFKAEDSGEKEFPITYAAAPGAKPVISGGRVITGLKKTGLKNIWKTDIPDVKRGKWDFRQLFIAGKRYTPARHPNREDYWFKFRRMNIEKKSAFLEQKDFKPWKPDEKVWVMLMRIWDISRFQVQSFRPETLEAGFKVPAVPQDGRVLGHWQSDGRYYMENSFNFLDSAGEWYLDKKQGILYVIPLPGHKLDTAEVIAPAVDTLIRFQPEVMERVRFLNFTRLTFRHSSWSLPDDGYDGHHGDMEVGGAIKAQYMLSCTFKSCTFEHLGRYALDLQIACQDNIIIDCEFRDVGAGAVIIGKKTQPKRKSRELARNSILDCRIHDSGTVWPGATGVWVGYASYTHIARNHIYNMPYDAIAVGWGFHDRPSYVYHNIIENNYSSS